MIVSFTLLTVLVGIVFAKLAAEANHEPGAIDTEVGDSEIGAGLIETQALNVNCVRCI